MTDQACGVSRFAFALALFTAAFALAPADPAASASFKFRKVVDNFDLIPDGGGAMFSPRGMPSTDGNWVVFVDANTRTIWRTTPRGGKLKSLIGPDTRIPGGWGKFAVPQPSLIQMYADTLVLVPDCADTCQPPGAGGAFPGIFSRSVLGGPIATLIDRHATSDTFPGDDKSFHGFTGDFRTGDGLLAFMNRQKVFAVPLGGGAITPVAGDQDKDFTPPQPHCCNFDGPSVRDGRVFLRGSNVNGHATLFQVRSNGNPLSFRAIATGNMHPPKTPPDHLFDIFEFQSPVVDQTHVFRGASTGTGGTIKGIYSKGTDGLTRLVDSNQAIPGGTGTFTFEFGGRGSPILASNGIVVFGDETNGKRGLYAVRQSGGRIYKIIATGDPLNGRTLGGALDVGRGSLSGNTLVFWAQYGNFQGEGIFSTEVVLP